MLPDHPSEPAAPEAPRRRFRKLRIAWSVGWGVLCLLLIALWVRSRDAVDSCQTPAVVGALHFQSGFGKVVVFRLPTKVNWKAGSFPAIHTGKDDILMSPLIGVANVVTFYNGWARVAVVPYSIATALLATLVGLPWLPTRFSLRALLIATTLVAVGLGLSVWLR
jgi:hypothetical protein